MDDKLSLSELQLLIRDSLYTALPGFYWVVAEISEIKENYAGHCYLELIEKQNDDLNIKARVRAIIWNKKYRFLKPLFESGTGESLKEGLKILVKVQIEYHELYGLSLNITDLDPAFTLGEMAVRRQMIIKRLEDEGIIRMNKEMDFPVIPRRIAIISSKNAAGYSDFIRQLFGNSYGYSFACRLFEAIMQGSETEESVISALLKISDHINDFDVVVVIRGGGSQSDLSWFDNYNIAYHVTQFPLPVITGIGHEKDMSVTDIVAFRSEKTPTAVAEFLVTCMLSAENIIKQLAMGISTVSLSIIKEYSEIVSVSRSRLFPVAKMLLSSTRTRLTASIVDLINVGKDYLVRQEFEPKTHLLKLISTVNNFLSAKESSIKGITSDLKSHSARLIKMDDQLLAGLINSVKILDPENTLKRGFTITSANGRIVSDVKKLRKGDIINTRFRNGSVDSKVTDKKHNQNGKERNLI